MSRQGAIRLVWYLAWVFLWTVVVRGLLSLGVRLVARRWPDTIGALSEAERCGWWISLVMGALLASAF
jgi:hypothetical protein